MELSIGADLFPILAGTLAAVTCGVLGNFLVLRRLSLMGDAISHSVLPGLVIAFIVTSTRDPVAMFIGAAAAGVATVVLVELVKKLGRVEPGAAMGVVFSVLFALGVLLIRQVEHLGQVDLDADCVLHGQLETLVWYGAPDTLSGLLDWGTFGAVPRQVTMLVVVCIAASVFVAVLFKELRIAAFDSELATTQGYHAGVLHYVLMVFVAVATVASFEAVGSIMVIAMLVCPAAAARLMTDRLGVQVWISVLLAIACGVGGYIAASAVPGWFGKDSVNAAGSMALVAGVLLVVVVFASPRHGVVHRWARRRSLARGMAADDLLAALYRRKEVGEASVGVGQVAAMLIGHSFGKALRGAVRGGHVSNDDGWLSLTDTGECAAARVIRRHRLWEDYLVGEAGFAPDHVHDPAEYLEHIPVEPSGGAETDPHGRSIPG